MMKKYTADDCYIIWVGLGEDRSITKLSEITGKSEGTLRNYSSKFKWSDKLKEVKEEDKSLIEAVVRDNSNAVLLLESEIYKGVSTALLGILRDSLPLLQPTGNPRELKTILDMYRLLNNQPTDISKQEVVTGVKVDTQTLSEEEKRVMDSLAARALFGDHQA